MAGDIGKQIDPPPNTVGEFDWRWKSWLNRVYEKLRGPLWDNKSLGIAPGKVPASNAPNWDGAMGNGGTHGAYDFAVNDYIDLQPFHTRHDIKPGSKIYLNIHWTTSSTATEVVKWEFTYSIAKAHQQEPFPASTVVTAEGTPVGVAWTHMVSEVAEEDAIPAPEPDTLMMMRVKRVTNGGVDNADSIYGLTVDIEYEKDRFGTPRKSPRDDAGNLIGFYEYGKK